MAIDAQGRFQARSGRAYELRFNVTSGADGEIGAPFCCMESSLVGEAQHLERQGMRELYSIVTLTLYCIDSSITPLIVMTMRTPGEFGFS